MPQGGGTFVMTFYVAIVDYNLGNLFSVKQACRKVGLDVRITSDKREILDAAGVILPGVGAFGDAMETLRKFDLVEPLRQVAWSGKPFLGICLGIQLLMEESFEFGHHQGLGIFPGSVIRFEPTVINGQALKVPQVGWNRINRTDHPSKMLEQIPDGAFMYFVHSFYVMPKDTALIATKSRYGAVEFCSSLESGNIFACQYHPERSGNLGLRIYQNFAAQAQRGKV